MHGQQHEIKYVWIFKNRVNVNTTTLTLFPENTQDLSFNQPQTVCQHTATLPTPPGNKAWAPLLVLAASQAPGLSAPTLLGGFSSTAKASGRRKRFAPNSTPFSKLQAYIDRECQGSLSTLQQPLRGFPMTSLGLQQLNWRACQNILPQYMSGVLKMVLMSTQPP